MSFSLQKANFWKRISAFMFDAILAFCLMLGVAIGVSFAMDYDAKFAQLQTVRAEIEIQYEFDQNGISFDMSEEDYNKLDETKKQIYDEANKAFLQDKRTVVAFREMLIIALINVSVSLLVADTIIYFVVPILFKNGQTLGKKCFGLAVVRSNGVKISIPNLLARSLIGRFAMETMVPLTIIAMMLLGVLGIVGTITLILFVVLEIGVMIYTKTNSCVHDLLTDTVVVDMASQQIFESQEARIEYEKEEAARKAAEQEDNQHPVAIGVFAPKTTPDVKEVAPQPTHAETTETAQAEQAENVENNQTETYTESTEMKEAEKPAPAIETAEKSAENPVEETEA